MKTPSRLISTILVNLITIISLRIQLLFIKGILFPHKA